MNKVTIANIAWYEFQEAEKAWLQENKIKREMHLHTFEVLRKIAVGEGFEQHFIWYISWRAKATYLPFIARYCGFYGAELEAIINGDVTSVLIPECLKDETIYASDKYDVHYATANGMRYTLVICK